MELYAEMKLMGDGYAGGFTNGMTMTHSETIEGFTQSDVIQEKEGQGKVYKNKEGLVLKVHEEKDGEAVRVWTEFRNESDRDVTVEMIASFALKGIEADKIHRLQSFWSAEGKLRKCRFHAGKKVFSICSLGKQQNRKNCGSPAWNGILLAD